MVAASRWTLPPLFAFKSDCKSVVTWVTDPSSAPWCFHSVLRECYQVFGSSIRSSLFHIGRTGNEAADILARMDSYGMNFIEFI